MISPKARFDGRRVFTGFVAVLLACIANYLGDKLLGQRIEIFYGLATFNFIWFLQIFVLPVFVGILTTAVFGLGGKWLCYFPPLIVRSWAYYETLNFIGVPEGTYLMPLGWWGFFVILAMETAAIGGFLGEIMFKRIYGRSPKSSWYKSSTPTKDTAD